MPGRRNFIKVWVDKWLRGPIRRFSAEERGVFIDLICMVGDGIYNNTGEIKIYDNKGYPDAYFEGLIGISHEVWIKTKRKLKKLEMIDVAEDNIIIIKQWKKFQPEYARQKPYRDRKKLIDDAHGIISSYRKLNPITGKKMEE